jgi:hypothetical protein
MGVKTNPNYASEAFLPMSLPRKDFRKDYVPFVRPTDAVYATAVDVEMDR